MNCISDRPKREYGGGLNNQNVTFNGHNAFEPVVNKHGQAEANKRETVVDSRGFLSPSSRGDQRQKVLMESKFRHALHSPVMAEPSAVLTTNQAGHKFHEVFQLKQGRYADIPAAKISEMMKSNSLDNAPTQSLLSVVNGILDESVEKKSGEIPHRVACLLRKVVQEIERRISTQAQHLKTQNNLFKVREEKYQSRIRVLDALATGTGEETQIVTNQLQKIKTEKTKMEEKRKADDEDVVRLMKEEKEKYSREISSLKQELEMAKKTSELQCLQTETKAKDQYNREISALKQELDIAKKTYELQCLQMEAQVKDQYNLEISSLKQELEIAKRTYEMKCLQMETQAKTQYDLEISSLKKELEIAQKKTQDKDQHEIEISSLKQELEAAKRNYEMKCLEVETQAKDQYSLEISLLKQELEKTKTAYETQCLQMETQAKGVETELEEKVRELERNLEYSTNRVRDHEEKVKKLERNLADSRNKIRELEVDADTKFMRLNKKERIYRGFVDSQFGSLQELRSFGESIKHDVLKSRSSYLEELSHIGTKLKGLAHAAQNYHEVLAENRKLFNELQDLKGNIRVFCRIRPFLPGQTSKQSIIEFVGENGELVIVNPSKQGRDGQRTFKFNKVFGPASTQGEVYFDTQPFVRSVLDGYNVCIFAYGQTGSGKTYTMSGPKGASKEEWGVNYRALDDLFSISQNRRSSITYEVGVQMVEIYNEQVRDLLSSEGSQKKLGILSTSQPNGLAVPDATLQTVGSTSDVMDLMDIGLKNRSVSATAMNERSSRSHSIVTIHVRGTDLKTGAALRGSLHLIDLAGSERVDRSEVTGDRLKEAQHINKSLSALGDVIFALSQKSSHVPYRNSKLTQLLQSSLGGQAKTLMFVQVNPDAISYSETLSTLKFAERVSGVELGAAKSSKDKDGRDVKELMDQVASLKDTISKKDEEIEQLQLLKDLKNEYPSSVNGEKRGTGSLRN